MHWPTVPQLLRTVIPLREAELAALVLVILLVEGVDCAAERRDGGRVMTRAVTEADCQRSHGLQGRVITAGCCQKAQSTVSVGDGIAHRLYCLLQLCLVCPLRLAHALHELDEGAVEYREVDGRGLSDAEEARRCGWEMWMGDVDRRGGEEARETERQPRRRKGSREMTEGELRCYSAWRCCCLPAAVCRSNMACLRRPTGSTPD